MLTPSSFARRASRRCNVLGTRRTNFPLYSERSLLIGIRRRHPFLVINVQHCVQSRAALRQGLLGGLLADGAPRNVEHFGAVAPARFLGKGLSPSSRNHPRDAGASGPPSSRSGIARFRAVGAPTRCQYSPIILHIILHHQPLMCSVFFKAASGVTACLSRHADTGQEGGVHVSNN